jgi:TetR/AcrR family transcriptional regulator, transcriptional repressor for nem operon
VPRPAKYDDTALLDRSYELLWRDGCDAVTIRDLERALDLRAPSIYRRFHSRDALLARSVDRYVERVVGARVRRHLAQADDPVAGLASFFLSALEPAPGEPVPRGCLLTVTAGQAAVADPGVRRAVDAGVDVVRAALATQVGRAAELGWTAPGADPGALTTALLVAFEGLLVLARAGRPDLAPAVGVLLDSCFPRRRPDPAAVTPSTPRKDHHP